MNEYEITKCGIIINWSEFKSRIRIYMLSDDYYLLDVPSILYLLCDQIYDVEDVFYYLRCLPQSIIDSKNIIVNESILTKKLWYKVPYATLKSSLKKELISKYDRHV